MDWPLLILVLLISLFGVISIFSATTTEVTEYPHSLTEMLETQSTYYSGAQLRWILVGLLGMVLIMIPHYRLFARWATVIYWLNVGVLILTKLIAQVGRGGMQAFLSVGGQGFQPSEFGKIAMIVCFARQFAVRKKPISTLRDFLIMTINMAFPMMLVAIQPDVGTAMVYIFVFAMMVFLSGTNTRLLVGSVAIAAALLLTLWYAMNNTAGSTDFRFTRILIWLDPESYPDDARQVINAQIAVGSGGLWGKGIVSPGSFASLGYISDDHTDFIYAIVCESFGMIGGISLVVAYILLIVRMFYLALKTPDPYGAYVITGVLSMLLAHIIENICMVIGLLPVTGIPLPFVSYGGSNLITNFIAIGLVESVCIRNREHARTIRTSATRVNPI